VTLHLCVSAKPQLHATLVSTTKVMRCMQCSLFDIVSDRISEVLERGVYRRDDAGNAFQTRNGHDNSG